ncbi:hypothetical protein GYN07_12365 [Rhizobium leguminosarum bv. viciae 248]|uniref:hypothetical protein n=1 Tax=Rhizobium leguminosarum TaxID=384 RepID=UPI0012BD58D1|nr:hypothetical protein [Rhizobium leguminosarum]MCA2408806.1 hypothetical protein [Rhizobium leguminosarum]QHW25082.1 hypothetical protein GYN07_12365 [Rhizobium leguminosarum bv. viciae 248]
MQQALKSTDKSLRHPKGKCLPGNTATGFPVMGRPCSTMAHFDGAYAFARRNQPSSAHGCVTKLLNSKNLCWHPENGAPSGEMHALGDRRRIFGRNFGENVKKDQN